MDGVDVQSLGCGVSVLWGLVRKKGSMHSGGWSYNFALKKALLSLKAVSRRGNLPTRHKTYSFRQLGFSWDLRLELGRRVGVS